MLISDWSSDVCSSDLLHVGLGVDLLLRVETLRRPGHGVEQLQAGGVQRLLEFRLGRLIELPGIVEAGRQERQGVDLEQWILVAERRDEALADRRLAGADSAIDLAAAEKGAARMGNDLQLALRALGDPLGELGPRPGMTVRSE